MSEYFLHHLELLADISLGKKVKNNHESMLCLQRNVLESDLVGTIVAGKRLGKRNSRVESMSRNVGSSEVMCKMRVLCVFPRYHFSLYF